MSSTRVSYSRACSTEGFANFRLVQLVDATYMGNKLRFINNSSEKLANCKLYSILEESALTNVCSKATRRFCFAIQYSV